MDYAPWLVDGGATKAIEVRGLTKAYGSQVVVEHIDFDVEQGEIFGIIGPNGSGKTTTVECLQGLRTADSGEISVLGLDPRNHAAELRSRMGAQLQESALPDRMRVWEALDLFGSFGSDPTPRDPLLAQWGLTEKAKSPFASLSGGQQQRLFVALALINKPELVFLDEMTTGLDPAARRVAWDLIAAIRERGTTVVLVTHFMDEAELLCDRIAVFHGNGIADVDTPSELVRRHAPGVEFNFSCDLAELSWIGDVEGVDSYSTNGDQTEVTGTGRALPLVCAGLVERGVVPEHIRVNQKGLEDAYLKLTSQ